MTKPLMKNEINKKDNGNFRKRKQIEERIELIKLDLELRKIIKR